jgi:hypothetical protein
MKAHPDGDVFFLEHVDGQQKLGERSADQLCPVLDDVGELAAERIRRSQSRGAQHVDQVELLDPSGGRVLKKSRSPVVIC